MPNFDQIKSYLNPEQKKPVDPAMMHQSEYNTPLSPEEEKQFQEWGVGRYGSKDNLAREMGSYDIKGAWKAIKNKEIDFDPITGHLPDTFKKPNHITFSNESKYSQGQGGQWINKDNRWQFVPSKTTLDLYGQKALQDYFKKYEPDSDLLMQ